MGKIKVHAGDFNGGQSPFLEPGWARDIESVEIATEEKVKKIGGTLAGAVVGGLLLGPLGAIGGMLVGGNKKEITFIAFFKDGRKFLCTTDSKTFIDIQAACFSYSKTPETPAKSIESAASSTTADEFVSPILQSRSTQYPVASEHRKKSGF